MSTEHRNKLPHGLKIIIGVLFLSMIGGISETARILFTPSPGDDFSWVLISISVGNTLIALGLIFRLRAVYYLFLICIVLEFCVGLIFLTYLGYSLIQGPSLAATGMITFIVVYLFVLIWVYKYFRKDSLRSIYLGEI
jgi:hypothetical protein